MVIEHLVLVFAASQAVQVQCSAETLNPKPYQARCFMLPRLARTALQNGELQCFSPRSSIFVRLTDGNAI